MGIDKIFIICLYFFLLWLIMVTNKKIERSRAKWAERKAELLEKFWREEKEKHCETEHKFCELQTKYDNVVVNAINGKCSKCGKCCGLFIPVTKKRSKHYKKICC